MGSLDAKVLKGCCRCAKKTNVTVVLMIIKQSCFGYLFAKVSACICYVYITVQHLVGVETREVSDVFDCTSYNVDILPSLSPTSWNSWIH